MVFETLRWVALEQQNDETSSVRQNAQRSAARGGHGAPDAVPRPFYFVAACTGDHASCQRPNGVCRLLSGKVKLQIARPSNGQRLRVETQGSYWQGTIMCSRSGHVLHTCRRCLVWLIVAVGRCFHCGQDCCEREGSDED